MRAYIIEENEKVPIDGKLLYRGISIDHLVEGFEKDHRFGFEETAYLLITGKLPNMSQLEEFKMLLDDCRKLPDGFAEDMIMKAPSNNIMNKLARCARLYSYDSNPDDLSYEKCTPAVHPFDCTDTDNDSICISGKKSLLLR